MIIRVDENNNIVQLITLGGIPEENPELYFRLNKYDVSEEILTHIYDYKYIDGEFITRTDNISDKIEKLRENKIKNLSAACNQVIENGMDFNGHHYSLKPEDQINLTNLSMMVQLGMEHVPYHADGELCTMYSKDEMLALSNAAIIWITFHTTYFNFMKYEINHTDDIETILAYHYGSILSDESVSSIMQILNIDDASALDILMVDIPDLYNYDRILGVINLDNYIWEEDYNVQTNTQGDEETNEESIEDNDLSDINISDSGDDSISDRGIDLYND